MRMRRSHLLRTIEALLAMMAPFGVTARDGLAQQFFSSLHRRLQDCSTFESLFLEGSECTEQNYCAAQSVQPNQRITCRGFAALGRWSIEYSNFEEFCEYGATQRVGSYEESTFNAATDVCYFALTETLIFNRQVLEQVLVVHEVTLPVPFRFSERVEMVPCGTTTAEALYTFGTTSYCPKSDICPSYSFNTVDCTNACEVDCLANDNNNNAVGFVCTGGDDRLQPTCDTNGSLVRAMIPLLLPPISGAPTTRPPSASPTVVATTEPPPGSDTVVPPSVSPTSLPLVTIDMSQAKPPSTIDLSSGLATTTHTLPVTLVWVSGVVFLFHCLLLLV